MESYYCANMNDDKVLPTLETFDKMNQVAEECRRLAAIRQQPKTPQEITHAYNFAADCLMYNLFGDLWITQNPLDGRYQSMKNFFINEVSPAIKMHKIKSWPTDDDFEQSLSAIFAGLKSLHEKNSAISITAIAFSSLKYIPIVASFAPTVVPAVVVGSVLINELGFVKTVDITVRAVKLGINICNISIRSLALVVNITSKLI